MESVSKLGENLSNNSVFLPKNSLPAIPENATLNIQNAINNNPVVEAVNNAAKIVETIAPNNSVASADYFSLFGFELSKTTLYILVGLILLVGLYYYFTKYRNNGENKKNKKNSKLNNDREKSNKSNGDNDEDNNGDNEDNNGDDDNNDNDNDNDNDEDEDDDEE